MCFSAAWVVANTPRMFMSITRSISSGVVSSNVFGLAVPALFTSTSRRPKVATAYVQTELMGSGQASDPRAMLLKDFLGEVIEIFKTQSNATEILVERVNPLGFAEQNGPEKYNAFFQQFNDAMMAPH